MQRYYGLFILLGLVAGLVCSPAFCAAPLVGEVVDPVVIVPDGMAASPYDKDVTAGDLFPEFPEAVSSLSFSSGAQTPPPIVSFNGLESDGAVPPDTIGDTGPNQYVQAVNSWFGTMVAVFDKRGNTLKQFSLSDLWTNGSDCGDYGYGDPVVLYDQLADRWMLSQFAIPNWTDDGEPAPPFPLCIAVSQTSDPVGGYYVYCFESDDLFPDYPKYAVWPDAYYLSTNDVDPASEKDEKEKASAEADEEGHYYVGVWAFDREKMLAGEPATWQKFTVERNFMLPCDLDGSMAPPDGSPNYFYTIMDDNLWPESGFPGDDRLEIWEFRADFENPDTASFAHTLDLETEPFNYFYSLNAVPQRGTFQRLDLIGEWPMWRLVYRNFGTHEVLLGNFTVDADQREKAYLGQAGIHWFELRKSGDADWSIYQEATHAPADRLHRWMGSIAMDGQGNIALGYSVSGATHYPSIRYAVRKADDPAGTLRREASLWEGRASQTGINRWGDYSAMTIDPADDTTFWYTNEYMAGVTLPLLNSWRTRVGTFQVQRNTQNVVPGGQIEIDADDVPGLNDFSTLPLVYITKPGFVYGTTSLQFVAVLDDETDFPASNIQCRLGAIVPAGEWNLYIRLSRDEAPYPLGYSLSVE